MTYADVILPLPLSGKYTYAVPPELINEVFIGSRVIVQFGKKKFYTAIVCDITTSNSPKPNIKDIVTALENYPIVTKLQLQYWEWIASYYICAIGDVYRAALPSALKLESETYVQINPNFKSLEPLTTNENKIYQSLLHNKKTKISDLEKTNVLSNIIPTIKSLSEKQAISLTENITNTYSVKKEIAIRFANKFTEDELISLLDRLEKAKKQQQLLYSFIHLNQQSQPILKKDLLADADSNNTVLSELIKKGILEIYDYEIKRFDFGNPNMESSLALNTLQQQAQQHIIESFKQHTVTLLHGVTSSGKTEIYIQLIKDVIKAGKQVLYLLPEIALTTQITERLKSVFGNKLGVYHSKFNENERTEIWTNLIKKDDYQIILGARSSIFLPFTNLGLIIVDEEHDSSYKQQDPAPRYNARDAAIMLANMTNAKVLLGTATPAIETYYNALIGKYALVELNERYANLALPNINSVNTKELRRKKQMKSILSPPLINAIQDNLNKKEQIILFQNRRGFAIMLTCKICAWTPQCNHCDVSLTHHKGQNAMVCHYCGAVYPIPTICPECETPTLESLGYGTERIEEEVTALFPEASVMRMDLDTTRAKKSYEKIISDFQNGNTDILIGTQMVSKGLDFENVSLVGVLNADNLLNYPDFRAHEKAFQLLTQVSGRAGRKKKQGQVILQTAHPSHPIINFVERNNYKAFFELQLEERRLFHYPPFFRLVSIIIRDRDERTAESASMLMATELKKYFTTRVLGPSKPLISRIQSLYIRTILLKIDNQASIHKVRSILREAEAVVKNNPTSKSILLHYDVDPI